MGLRITQDARLNNAFGALSDEVRARLRAVLTRPTQASWDAAHCIILTWAPRHYTLWQAVIAVDPTFPRSKPCDAPWPRIPDSFTIARAIKLAAGRDN